MITIDTKQLEHCKVILSHIPGAVPKAVARAINRAASKGKTVIINEATENYYVSKKDVRSTIKITKATPERMSAFIKSRGTRRELKHSLILPSLRPSHITHSGPFIAVRKDSSPRHIAKTFINNGSASGKPHVFSRITGQREPWIKYGLSIPQMLGNENVKQAVEKQATAFLNERLKHEIDIILKGVVK